MIGISGLVLVTGATGSVGCRLVNHLSDIGNRIRILSRKSLSQNFFSQSVETVVGEIVDQRTAALAVADAAIVLHLAAKLHIPNPTAEMSAEYEKVNVEGTRILVEAAQAAGVERLVFFSTISVYGHTGSEAVDESAPTRPDTIYAETKLRAEEIVLSARKASGEPLGTVLRMAAIYGPRMKGNYVSLANALAKGRFLPVGDGTNLRTLVYVDDAVRAAVLAAQSPNAAGRIYNVTDGTVHSLKEIMAAICEALGKPPPRLYVPTGPARVAARAVDSVLALGGRSTRFASAVDKFVESVAVRGDRIQRELEFRPEFDLQKGWQATFAGKKSGCVWQ